MNIEYDFSQPGQMFFTQNRLAKMQEAYKGVQTAFANHLGDKVIISGIQVTNGTVSDGWVSYNGEILPFVGGSQAAYVAVEETITGIPYNDNTSKPVLKERRLRMETISTSQNFPFSDLVRPGKYSSQWLTGDIKQVTCTRAYILNNFDLTTGEALPTSERAGWKIKFSAGGRVLVGWSKDDTNPGDSNWDVAYNTPGSIGGEKLHQLVTAELPRFRLSINTGDQPGRSDNANDRDVMIPGTSTKYTDYVGGDQPHENRQPFEVVLTIEKM